MAWKYGITIAKFEDVTEVDAVIFAVPHDEFKSIKLEDVKRMFQLNDISPTSELERGNDEKDYVLIDLKRIFNRKEAAITE